MLISSLYFLNPDVKSIFDRTMAWFDIFFFRFEQKNYSIWSEAFLLYFIIGLIRFTNDWLLILQVARKSWRRWSAIQYVLRAWVGNPSLSSNFLKTSELNSVGTKTDVYLILIINHQKICQITKIWTKNRLANLWSSSKLTSQATKRWKKKYLVIEEWGRLGGGGVVAEPLVLT